MTLPRLFLVLVAAVLLPRCAELTPESAERTPASRRVPSRVLVVTWTQPTPTPSPLPSAATPQLARFAARSLAFPNAETGHLSEHHAVFFPALISGRQPRHLPWQDEMTRLPRRGPTPVERLGERGIADALRASVGAATLPAQMATRGTTAVVTSDGIAAATLAAGAGMARVVANDDAVARVALETLASPEGWRGLFVAFSSPLAADGALGRLLDGLDAARAWDDTVVVLVAQRGVVSARLGRGAADAPPPLARVLASPACQGAVAGSTWRLWTSTRDPLRLRELLKPLRADDAGVREIYAKYDAGRSEQYIRVFLGKGGSSLERAPELLGAQVAPGAPDVVVQPVGSTAPALWLAIASPGLAPGVPSLGARVTTADIAPMVLRLMQLPDLPGSDGSALALEPALASFFP